jgi:hypothetical protein
MRNIQLQRIPNQSFTVRLDNDIYNISIKECSGIMSVSIIRNNIVIQTGVRAVSGNFLIDYDYLEKGNFFIETQNDEYPHYSQFEITQFLNFASAEEIEAAKNGKL